MFNTLELARRPNWFMRVTSGLIIVAIAAGVVFLLRMTRMPLTSYAGPLPALSTEQAESRDRLAADVKQLSATIGERSLRRAGSLKISSDFISSTLKRAGYAVSERPYSVEGQEVINIEADLVGVESTKASIVVGAHYDSVARTVGANDNATGVAAVLELARLMRGRALRRTVRFVLFANEEPPYFQTKNMGSRVYVHQLRQDQVPISAMISLETIGFYSDVPGSQKYPLPLGLFYPSRGDFIAFMGDSRSRELLRECVRSFRGASRFPSEGIAAPSDWPGIGWSDHWSFWQEGIPAIMITDTAVFRYPYYHTGDDTTRNVDFDRVEMVVDGVRHVIEKLADQP